MSYEPGIYLSLEEIEKQAGRHPNNPIMQQLLFLMRERARKPEKPWPRPQDDDDSEQSSPATLTEDDKRNLRGRMAAAIDMSAVGSLMNAETCALNALQALLSSGYTITAPKGAL